MNNFLVLGLFFYYLSEDSLGILEFTKTGILTEDWYLEAIKLVKTVEIFVKIIKKK